jgi:hypothetical protein
VIIRLTPEQEAAAEQRLDLVIEAFRGVPDRAGVPNSRSKRRLGVRAEFAASVAVGLPLSPGLRDHYDLAGAPIHVRSSRLLEFALQPPELRRMADQDVVLAVFATGQEFNVAGWLLGGELESVGSMRSVGGHPPALWVSRSSLRPLYAMPGYAGSERAPSAPAPAGSTELLHTCHWCGAFVPTDALATQPIGEEVFFVHREPCYSEDVPR